jgi:sugar/nucleoside kinase (ribokinase family)
MKDYQKLDCIVAGDVVVDVLMEGVIHPEIDKEKLVTGMQIALGGSGGITAHNLARLGARTGFVGVIGQDAFGQFIEDRLRGASVDLEALRRNGSDKTGITVWLSKNLKRAAVTYSGTLAMLRARDIPNEYLRNARHLHIGHYFLLTQLHKDAVRLFKRAKELGLTTSLDCNYDPAETWDSGLFDVLRHTDIFFPNQNEARLLTKSKSPESAARELSQLAGTVVVKMGARGALVCNRETVFRIPAKKTRVIDATGAGDSFNAGFLARFLHGDDLRLCALGGVEAGARCVARVGGITAFEPQKRQSRSGRNTDN